MKTPFLFLLFATCVLISPVSFRAAQDSPGATTDDVGWPRSYSVENAEIVLDEPQIEKWEDSIVQARFAVSIKPAGESRALLGAFTARADTLTNSEARTVAIYNIKAQDVQFPDAPASQAAFSRLINALAPEKPVKVSLDKLLASVPSDDIVTKTTVLTETRNKAPRIIVSNSPALLLAFDGAPIFRPIPGSGLEAAVNTPATVLRPDGRKSPLYLLTNDGIWLSADSIQGSWQQTGGPPAGLERIPADHPVAIAVKSVSPPPGAVITVPEVVMSEEPAEMIQLDGKPNYKRIGDLPLVRVGNTKSPLFYHFDLSAFYVLISGRWFTAQELKGPWVYVPHNSLPLEFAQIPSDDPSAYVRVCVTGTYEAEVAVKEAQIPIVARVNIREAPTIEVDYDGEPIFEEIAGTEMYYAVNTAYEVIRTGDSYYCCHDGLWFIADRPFGSRWRCATSLPRIIFTIPPSCPLYHTRFCDIQSYEDDEVVYRYSSGYYGTYIDPETRVCIYGTGYRYQPYVSDSYYCGRSWTYGLGSNYSSGVGFINESPYVARTNWYQEDSRRDRRDQAVWRGTSGSRAVRTTSGGWQSMVPIAAPYSTWKRGVTTRHDDLTAQFVRRAPAPAADRPRVVSHGLADERSASVFRRDPQTTRDNRGGIRDHRSGSPQERNLVAPRTATPSDLAPRGAGQPPPGHDPEHHKGGKDIAPAPLKPLPRDDPRSPIIPRHEPGPDKLNQPKNHVRDRISEPDISREQRLQPKDSSHDRVISPENSPRHKPELPKEPKHDRVIAPDNSRAQKAERIEEPRKTHHEEGRPVEKKEVQPSAPPRPRVAEEPRRAPHEQPKEIKREQPKEQPRVQHERPQPAPVAKPPAADPRPPSHDPKKDKKGDKKDDKHDQ